MPTGAYPEDALSDELSSHRQTQTETKKIKFPAALITYRDEDILAVGSSVVGAVLSAAH